MRLHLATKAAALRLKGLIGDLEARYRPDQPRAPGGTPEGGQWIIDLRGTRQQALRETGRLIAGIAEELEGLGGGRPVFRPSPAGAIQFIFPNGMVLRFDIFPGQYLPKDGPHINLHISRRNYHFFLGAK